eukprot:gnl/MRDRNA2_/MRDRNA2_71464_c0_seq1.p1 gnl/MRDRNA2_/MRDRNA2_71464_c0~~gnl/MRDRNA2_/MRDRNA2_71464_c0_seq1.p1  ORF type:complete len:143 (+),score=19.11 gnl/MRDRNA2_/MRDRNA2_71464_c0_seq1:109-537(+)
MIYFLLFLGMWTGGEALIAKETQTPQVPAVPQMGFPAPNMPNTPMANTPMGFPAPTGPYKMPKIHSSEDILKIIGQDNWMSQMPQDWIDKGAPAAAKGAAAPAQSNPQPAVYNNMPQTRPPIPDVPISDTLLGWFTGELWAR